VASGSSEPDLACVVGQPYDPAMTPVERRWTAWGMLASTVLMAACQRSDSRVPIDVHAIGPQIGERVPDFRLPDQNGRLVTLDSILGPNGAVLLFHRSADW
jgi:hypothetical protein